MSNKLHALHFFSLCLLFILLQSTAYAGTNSRYYDKINYQLQWLSTTIDRGFGSDIEDSKAHTRASIRSDLEVYENGDYDIRFRARAALDLPNLENRWRLAFSGDFDDDEGADQGDEGGLNLTYKAWDNIDIDAGVSNGLRDPELWLEFAYEYDQRFGHWDYDAEAAIVWDQEDQWYPRVKQSIECLIDEHTIFRTQLSSLFYQENTELNASMSITQEIGDGFVSLEWHKQWLPGDPKLDEAQVALRLRKNIWQRRLYAEVAPAIRWNEETRESLSPETLVMFRLELFFRPE